MTVVQGWIHCNILAKSQAGDADPYFSDGARELVTEGDRKADASVLLCLSWLGWEDWATKELVDVAAANATIGDLESDFVGTTWTLRWLA